MEKIINLNNEQINQSKVSLEDVKNESNCGESGKILRSQRPLQTMGWYQPHELAGIVPDDVVRAFQHEQILSRRECRKKRYPNVPGANRKERKQNLNRQSNKIFNEFVEQYCVENNIDQMKLLENESERKEMVIENKVKNPRREKMACAMKIGSFDMEKFPRSKEALAFMTMYDSRETRNLLPKKFLALCGIKREALCRDKMKELEDPNMMSKRMVRCESYKFYNELIEDYCNKHGIDITLFTENSMNNKRKIPKERMDKLRYAKKKNQKFKANNRKMKPSLSKSSEESPKRYWNQSKSRSNQDAVTASPSTSILAKYSERRFWTTDRSQTKMESTNFNSNSPKERLEENFVIPESQAYSTESH
eukprot:TCONS_00025202-protein